MHFCNNLAYNLVNIIMFLCVYTLIQTPKRPIAKSLGENRVEIAFDAKVFRGEARSGYPYIQPYCVNFIAQCAFQRDLKKTDGTLLPYKKAESENMEARIDLLLMAADHHGAKYLVLGALGCGAFHHPVCTHQPNTHHTTIHAVTLLACLKLMFCKRVALW